jgi:hypothetical protein
LIIFTTNKLFRATVLQLLKILNDWSEALIGGGYIDAVYTDFEKAFDKVSHQRLVSKLRSINVDSEIVQ